MTYKYVKKAKLKHVIISLLIISITIMTGMYYLEKLLSGKKIIKDIKIDSEASLVLNSMHHTSTRNGIKEWTLEARSAKLLKNEAKATLTGISVNFFLKNGEIININSNQGEFDTKENYIYLFDSVRVRYGGAIMQTDQLHYEKKDNIIYSKVHVTVIRDLNRIESDTMRIELNTNTLIMSQNVSGSFSGSSVFF